MSYGLTLLVQWQTTHRLRGRALPQLITFFFVAFLANTRVVIMFFLYFGTAATLFGRRRRRRRALTTNQMLQRRCRVGWLFTGCVLLPSNAAHDHVTSSSFVLLLRVHVQDPLCTPALRALGNLVSGQEDWANTVMVHAEFLPCLDAILKSQVTTGRC